MITFDEAVALIVRVAKPIGVETVPLAAARGRVLAREVISRVDAPRCDAAAMDGYAVRSIDLASLPARLRVVGRSSPGAGFREQISAGQCIRIFTGAPIPSGGDRVIVQEVVERDGDYAVIRSVSSRRHIRCAASDFAAGDVLLEPGRRLDPQAMVAVAGADIAQVTVWRRPVLAMISTGDELVPPGQATDTPGTIPESISAGVIAMAAEWGASPVAAKHLPDELVLMQTAADECLSKADLIIVAGGASVGERDFARAMFEAAGLALIFSKVAIKPGKPVWFGRARGRLILGLPGNPTSALVTARLFLAPLLAGLAGRQPDAALLWRNAPLARDLEPCGDRESFLRGRWLGDAVLPLSHQESSGQKALAHAELLIRRRLGAPCGLQGDLVEVLEL